MAHSFRKARVRDPKVDRQMLSIMWTSAEPASRGRQTP